MKKLALLSVFLALPGLAQTPDAKPAPVPPTVELPAQPRPLTESEQVSVLLELVDAQGAWLNQLNNLSSGKGSFEDQKLTNEASAKYSAALLKAKAAAGAKDTPGNLWQWDFRAKKWFVQAPTQPGQ